ncbi:MAG: glycosyltransferase family 39 protein [Candidatus Pacebacteria bacterium]|nr:glycosyltransferase family 39 protein [Candidatus Paceibacterota bacterium]
MEKNCLRRRLFNSGQCLAVGILLAGGLWYRGYGLRANPSYWMDENHLAIFVRAILKTGRPVLANGYSTGAFQWLYFWLSALFAKILGFSPLVLRLPAVIFGGLTILTTYLLGREWFSRVVGLTAAFWITFLKIEILWSRQARPYQALQFFFLLGAYLLYQLGRKKPFSGAILALFLLVGILASLLHGLGGLILVNGFLYLAFRFGKKLKWNWWLFGLFLGIGWIYFFRVLLAAVISNFGQINNFFYYRVFLIRNYWPLVLLASAGIFFNLKRKRDCLFLSLLFLTVQFLVGAFFLSQPFVRYFYIVFPFLVLLAAAGLDWLGGRLTGSKRSESFFLRLVVLGGLIFLVWANMGEKFSFLPQKTYSLNEDMLEIPEVDWSRIYGHIKKRLAENPETVLVVNWNDLPVWYLGEGVQELYLLKRPSQENYQIDPLSGAKMIYSLADFKKLINQEEAGLIVLDSWDDAVTDGVRDYCLKNLRQELKIDRLYPIQPRLWPVDVYSWGEKEPV